MWELTVVELDITQDGLFEVLAAAKAVALQDVLDLAIKAFDHAIGLRAHGRCQAVLDPEIRGEAVKVVVACRCAAEKAGQTIGEFLGPGGCLSDN